MGKERPPQGQTNNKAVETLPPKPRVYAPRNLLAEDENPNANNSSQKQKHAIIGTATWTIDDSVKSDYKTTRESMI